MAKAVFDPALHGKMFRLLLDSELFAFIRADQKLAPGEYQSFNIDNPPRICIFTDDAGSFAPIYASMEAAEKRLRTLPGRNELLIAGMSAPILLQLVNDGETVVRLLTQSPARFIIHPESIQALLNGDLTHSRPSGDPPETMILAQVLHEDLPKELLNSIRKFCNSRPVPLGIYAFLGQDPATGEWIQNEVRFVLWLREADPSFYNDFALMVAHISKGFKPLLVEMKTGDPGLDFVTSTEPLWPVL